MPWTYGNTLKTDYGNRIVVWSDSREHHCRIWRIQEYFLVGSADYIYARIWGQSTNTCFSKHLYGDTIHEIWVYESMIYCQQRGFFQIFFFAWYRTPILRAILPLRYLICSPNFKCWSTTIPTNLVCGVFSIFTLSTIRSLFNVILHRDFLNILKWVFFKFKESLFILNQCTTLQISVFICRINSFGFLPEMNIFESSANRSGNNTLDTQAMSLI